MSRTRPSREESENEFTDAVQRDWQWLQNANPPPAFDRMNSPFSPADALDYAEKLSQIKSDEEAHSFTMYHVQGLANFMVAAHFAYHYLPLPKDEASQNFLRFGPPYVALAKAVAKFLKSLKPQPDREQRYD